MGFLPTMLIYIFFVVTSLLFELSHCATIVVDGVSEWKNPQVQIGDSVIFQHKNHYNLYIFKNQIAFSVCNFSQATLLTKPSSSYTWHTSRPGYFYFSFNNGSNQPCLEGQKIAVKVSPPAPQTPAASPELPPSMSPPLPSSGGIVASSPAFPWPFQPRESTSPSPAPSLTLRAASPENEGIPFINSNPAVPLPTGEVDSATIRPLPTSGHDQYSKQVVGYPGVQRALSCLVLLMMMI